MYFVLIPTKQSNILMQIDPNKAVQLLLKLWKCDFLKFMLISGLGC